MAELRSLVHALSKPSVLVALGAFSIFAIVATVVLVPLALARLPSDYLVRERARKPKNILILVLKNLLGVLVILLGVAFLLLPGQGILTILLGLGLVNFPGRRRLELWVVSRPTVLKTINALRRKLRRAPLEIPRHG